MSRIYVVGSINVDLVAFAARLPSPGETIRGDGFERFPGGKGANQAVAAARAGVETAIVGAVGQDAFGDFMRTTLAELDVAVGQVECLNTSTGVALIIVGGGENQIVVVPGANDLINPEVVNSIDFREGDVCLAQLETTPKVVEAAFKRARARGAKTIFNPAPAIAEGRALLSLADVIVVNETECEFFTGTAFDFANASVAIKNAAAALELLQSQALVVTGGAEGLTAIADGTTFSVPGHRVSVVDTTGAGDCFCGFLAAGMSRGQPFETVLVEANAAAALSVQCKGAAPSLPNHAEVRSFLEKGYQDAPEISALVL